MIKSFYELLQVTNKYTEREIAQKPPESKHAAVGAAYSLLDYVPSVYAHLLPWAAILLMSTLLELGPIVGAAGLGGLALGKVGGKVIRVLVLDLGGARGGSGGSSRRGGSSRGGSSRGTTSRDPLTALLSGLALREVGGEIIGVLVLDLGSAREHHGLTRLFDLSNSQRRDICPRQSKRDFEDGESRESVDATQAALQLSTTVNSNERMR